MNKIEEARKVFDKEILAVTKTRDVLDETFETILDLITGCQGKVILTGMGKPGHIAKKLAATFSSLGTSAFYLHPGEALHGDLGMITEKDVVIAISYSGESEEVTQLLPTIKYLGAKLIAISGNPNSTLVKYSDVAQILPPFEEACYLGLAPTSSTTAALVYGDALAVVASRVYGFGEKDFGIYHPSGSLGKKLRIRAADLMKSGEDCPSVPLHSTLRETIIELSRKELGIVVVVDDGNHIKGVITDGDLRRLLQKEVDIYQLDVENVMTANPVCVEGDTMAVEALKLLRARNISSLLIRNKENELLGVLRLQSIVDAGIL